MLRAANAKSTVSYGAHAFLVLARLPDTTLATTAKYFPDPHYLNVHTAQFQNS